MNAPPPAEALYSKASPGAPWEVSTPIAIPLYTCLSPTIPRHVWIAAVPGTITKKVTVTAYSFTQSAVKKIEAAGGKCLSYNDFIKSNPKGTNVMVIG